MLDNDLLPVEFFSKIFNQTEVKWATTDKEAFAIVKGLQKFDRFVRGKTVEVRTDRASLQWIFDKTKSRVSRWAATLVEYDIKICNRKGREIVAADYFSRYLKELPEPVEDRMCFPILTSIADKPCPSIEELKAEQQKEEERDELLKRKGYYR